MQLANFETKTTIVYFMPDKTEIVFSASSLFRVFIFLLNYNRSKVSAPSEERKKIGKRGLMNFRSVQVFESSATNGTNGMIVDSTLMNFA